MDWVDVPSLDDFSTVQYHISRSASVTKWDTKRTEVRRSVAGCVPRHLRANCLLGFLLSSHCTRCTRCTALHSDGHRHRTSSFEAEVHRAAASN